MFLLRIFSVPCDLVTSCKCTVFISFSQDYLGAVIVLTAAVAAIWTSSYGVQPGLVGLGLTYALTVRRSFNSLSFSLSFYL